MSSYRKATLCLTLVLIGSALLLGQATSGDIMGVIVDESKAVLPGVGVTVRNTETNVQRSVISDDQGRYRVVNLNPGTYEVTAELTGFKTVVRSGIVLTIGREAVVDIALSVGELSERVTVTGDAPLVETTTSTLGGVVNRDQIIDLPLNGRGFQDLVSLQPGVILPTKTTNEVTQGVGSKFSIGGARISFNQFLLDGGEINDGRDSTPASVGGILMGVEAVREFKVMTGNYSAEYGRSAGAVINVATKSGTSKLHGSVYEFLRNSALDAKNFFTVGRALPFKRNQFGFEVDGPIVKDKLFFMSNYEGMRQRLVVPVSYLTLDASARQGILPGLAPITVNAAIRPYLELYPLPTPGGRSFNNGSAEYLTQSGRPIDENFFTMRLDYVLSDANAFFGRYTWDKGVADNTNSSFDLFSNPGITKSRNIVIQGRTIFSPSLVNTAMFTYNRPVIDRIGLPQRTIAPAVTTVGRPVFGAINTTGLSAVSKSFDQTLNQKVFDFTNGLVLVRGAHSLKFGGTFKLFDGFQNQEFQLGGDWTFSSIQGLLLNNSTRLDVVAPGSDLKRNVRQTLFGFYIQDDFRVMQHLTLNMGVRYEFITVPYEKDGKQANLKSLYDSTIFTGKPLFNNPSLKNFAPRIGFAWDISGDGRTALRSGFGIFYAQVLPRTYERNMRGMPPWKNVASLTPPPPLPLTAEQAAGLRGVPLSTVTLETVEYNLSTPYMMQYNLSLQRQVLPETVVTASYVGSRGVHLPRKPSWNIPIPSIVGGKKFFAAGLPRRNPNFGPITPIQADSNSVYNSLQLGLNKRLSQGFILQANYNFSRAIDMASDLPENAFGGSPSRPQDPDERNEMRGLADFHVQHSFTMNTSYRLPWGNGLAGLAGTLANGWETNSIVRVASGPPFSVELGFDRARTTETNGQRPNLKPGYSNNPILGGPDRYFDVNAFELQPAGFFGNMGRSTLIAPGVVTVDFSALKNFAVPSISEDFHVQFRAELFNALNHPNFNAPRRSGPGGVIVLNQQGATIASAARITDTTSTARQIQMALKILW